MAGSDPERSTLGKFHGMGGGIEYSSRLGELKGMVIDELIPSSITPIKATFVAALRPWESSRS